MQFAMLFYTETLYHTLAESGKEVYVFTHTSSYSEITYRTLR